MPSPEWDIIDILCEAGDEPLGFALGQYQSWIPSASFERVRHAVWMMISTSPLVLLRGPDSATAEPVPEWEVRHILADYENWVPPDDPPRFWLHMTDEGCRSHWGE
ncbi:MAG TPA: hypothetical protein VD886_20965 [Herpetosiphonaceae bacterium]|nr:hypothetical protein [Herpetosiphonaceae bacterium]